MASADLGDGESSSSGVARLAQAEAGPEVVLLDAGGMILAANGSWRAALGRERLGSSIGEPGTDYVEAVTRLHPQLETAWLRAQITALTDRQTDEVLTTVATGEGEGRRLRHLRINRLEQDGATLLVAAHRDLSGIAEARDTLQGLQDQLADARIDERRRILGSLAEMTDAPLEALRRDLEQLRDSVDGDGALDLVARMESSLSEAMLETHNLGSLLHPAALDEGLAAAGRRLARGFAADAGVRLRYRTTGAVDAAPRIIQEAAFRVLQEALSNVHRHARASALSVTLAARDEALHIRIADDGVGLRDGYAMGVGVSGMQSRAAELGGAVEVIGARRGVIVLARLPYAAGASS
jgi:signal transduction histidine kinase